MLLETKIKKLYSSNLTDYRIAKDSGIKEQTINYFHHRLNKLGNMTLKNAQILGQYYDKLKKKQSI